MFRLSLLAGGAFLLLTLTSCPKSPAVEYRLSAEQLAWQGYQIGEELRFGHAQDSRVRTYRVTEIRDQMEKQYTGGGGPGLPFPRKESPLCQHRTVVALRTDSLYRPLPILDLQLSTDGGYDRPLLRAEAEWETFGYAPLPLDNIINGTPIDTLYGYRPGTRLLASATLGPATYSQVIRVDNRPAPGTAPLGRSTRRLYYARGKGVVAFEEAGNDLWYRLP